MGYLLIHPPMYLNEGPMGYLFRLAHENLVSIQGLQALGLDLPAISSWLSKFDEGSPIQEVEYRDVITKSYIDYPNIWVKRFGRFCPMCLAKSDKWHFSWELLFADACVIHECWLVDTCALCGKQITWRRASLMHCDCGAPLSCQLTSKCPDAVVQLSLLIQNSIIEIESFSKEPFSSLASNKLLQLIKFLGIYTGLATQNKPQKIANLDFLSVSWNITSQAAEIIHRWPNSLYESLDKMQSVNISSGRLSGRFGGVYTTLYRCFGTESFSELRRPFESYIASHWRGAFGKRNRRMPEYVLLRLAWISPQLACEQLNISRQYLSMLVKEGKIRGEVRQTPSGREFLVVSRIDVENLAPVLEGSINLQCAAKLLGLAKNRVRCLLSLLEPEAHKTINQYGVWVINKLNLFKVIEFISSLPIIPDCEEVVTFYHILRYWCCSDIEVGSLLKVALDGSSMIKGRVSSECTLPGLVFCRLRVKEFLSSIRSQHHNEFTIPEVARLLNIKQEVAYFLVRKGILKTTSILIGNIKAQGVARWQLEYFRLHYEFARDIAGEVNGSSRAVTDVLSRLGVEPISGPNVDGGRQIIFLASENLNAAKEKLANLYSSHRKFNGNLF